MTTSIRHAATWVFVAVATCATPVFAQNNAAPAATAANGYGADTPAPANRTAKNRTREQQLLGAPREYGGDDMQGKTDDTQRAALLDEQRMTVTGAAPGGQPAPGKGQRKAPAAANGQLRVADQLGRANAAAGLLPEGAAKNAYADPYGAGKRTVYRSPW